MRGSKQARSLTKRRVVVFNCSLVSEGAEERGRLRYLDRDVE